MSTSLAAPDLVQQALPAGPPPEPYRGTAAFRLADAQTLLAREAETEELVQLTTVYRGVLLFGESGVGKSSMLNAGFIPEALRLGFSLERIRVRAEQGAELLIECITTDSVGVSMLPSALMKGRARHVEGDPMSIGELRRRLAALEPAERTILIFDQFEEFISLFEDAPAPEKQAETRKIQAELLQLFEDLHHDAHLPIKLLFSFREDYLGKLAPLIRRVPALGDHFVRLAPLDATALRTIVEGPLKKFPAVYGGRLQGDTVELVIRQFAAKAGGGDINLSEVQIVCRLLWDDPALGNVLPVKRIDGLLDMFLTNALALFKDAAEKEALKVLLSFMVTPGGVRDIVSLDALLERAAERTTLPRERLTGLLAAIDGEKTRLVRSEKRDDIVYYTILSEFLIRWIRQWRIDFVKARERKALEEGYAAERKRRSRRLWIRGGLGIVVLALLVQGFVMFTYRDLNREISNSNYQLMLLNQAKDDSLIAVGLRADSANARAQALDTNLTRRQDSLLAKYESVRRSLARAAQEKTATLQQQLNTERSARMSLERIVQGSQTVATVSDSSRTATAEALELAQVELATERQRSLELRSQTLGIAEQLDLLAPEIGDPAIRVQVQRLLRQLPGADGRLADLKKEYEPPGKRSK